MQLYALFRLGFPSAPRLLSLNLAAYHNSQAHSTKGTPSPFRASTACGSMVSGSLSLPSRGSFHLSLTVLCAIGSCRVFSLGGWSPRIPTGFHVSRRTQVRTSLPSGFRLRGFHPLCLTVPSHSANLRLSSALSCALQPHICLHIWFGLLPVRSPLLGESHLDFFSCWYLDGSLPSVCHVHTIYSCARGSHSRLSGYPIRKSRDQGLLAAPPRLSQLSTSFFAWQLLGIHAWTLLHLTILFFRFLRYK